jgi:CheY-like chemotaxis protein
VRRYISAVLEDRGYRVIQAASGPEALALATQSSGTIHLLVTDLVMPLMNGHELAEKLKELRSGVKVLFISGYADETIGRRKIAAGEFAYLAKPFGPEGLAEKVREVLGNESARNRVKSSGADGGGV